MVGRRGRADAGQLAHGAQVENAHALVVVAHVQPQLVCARAREGCGSDAGALRSAGSKGIRRQARNRVLRMPVKLSATLNILAHDISQFPGASSDLQPAQFLEIRKRAANALPGALWAGQPMWSALLTLAPRPPLCTSEPSMRRTSSCTPQQARRHRKHKEYLAWRRLAQPITQLRPQHARPCLCEAPLFLAWHCLTRVASHSYPIQLRPQQARSCHCEAPVFLASECPAQAGGSAPWGRRRRTWLHWPPAAMKPLPTARLVGVKLSFWISADCAHQAHGRSQNAAIRQLARFARW